ncbi:iron-containing alcohol dehydrogenase, partial [Candidatus Thorarchaeota archaeon]
MYQVFIGESLLTKIVEFLDNKPKRVFIITDETVAKLYLDTLTQSLKDNGVETISEILADGESSKTLDTVFNLYNFLLENEASRSDIIIAFGGGVIGDITGFVASTFKRGLNFIQVPTTLLAQVDSAVGGKTGVNFNGGKNLIGTFYQPSVVIVDVTLLRTLSKTDFVAGLAEVIK